MNRPSKVSMSNSPKAISGFTLVELMVTIVVLAIIVAIAVPNMSQALANQRVKSTSATIASALNEAKAESRIRKRDMTVEYIEYNSTDRKIVVSEGTGSNKTQISEYQINSNSAVTIIPATGTTLIISSIQRANDNVTYQICDNGVTSESPYQVTISVGADITQKQAGSC
ncbi:Tfp pilus assembly protein FimT/FimU [Psychrobacter sp. I-STPA6b]|uniref:pilus assembly FimT family protein n=1 Tax=Psychrobacter sp. I-STPA6b TaxID=2585718 RepID=UPI001D0CD39E|nr:prepilin-type N-terminal cleavage/methylation domain-containing protein [Psychrobacter sp. I-STPA6b]